MKLKASNYSNEDPIYYKYREVFVGIFVLIPFILIPIVLAVIVIRSDWARERFEMNFTHRLNIQLNEGNEVYILSKRVGLVKKVTLDPQGFIAVKLRVDEQYRPLIRTDSKIRLKQKNMVMGDWQVELVIGSQSASMVEDGDTLSIIPPLDIQELSDQVIAITGTINEILDTVAHGHGIISSVLNSDSTLNLRAMETFGSVRTALSSLNEVLASSNAVLRSTGVVVDSVIAKRTPAVYDGVDSLLRRTNTTVEEISDLINSSDSIPAEVSKTMEMLNHDLEEADVLLKSIQRLRILRKKVAEVKSEKVKP